MDDKDILMTKIKKQKKVPENVIYAESWIKNLVLHPGDVNKEYNCMDKH
jgi:hypothetical protein